MLPYFRSQMFSRGKWQNPYVTDGLVAMWDVEWNAGGGKHSSDSRQIVNLCGGAPIVLAQGVVVGAKSATYTTAAARDWGGITDDMPELPLAGRGTTSEAVWRAAKIANWSAVNYAFLYRNGSADVNNTNTRCGMGYFRNSESSLRVGWRYANIGVLNSLASTTNQVRAWNDQVGYCNMAPLTGTSDQKTAFVNDAKVRILGSTVANAEIEFACLRIYNRSLSDAERAANYAVDAARFNLPAAT